MSKPYLCPVCEGRGSVPPGFYSPGTTYDVTQRETCRTCSGMGIVWAPGPSDWNYIIPGTRLPALK